MTYYIGTNATIKIGSTTVAKMAEWSFEDSKPVIEVNPFGTQNREIAGMGNRAVRGTISGYLNVDTDTDGQTVLETAYLGGTTVSGFKLYYASNKYYGPDTVTDPNACVFITSNNVSATQNEVVPIEFGFEVSGPWGRFTDS